VVRQTSKWQDSATVLMLAVWLFLHSVFMTC